MNSIAIRYNITDCRLSIFYTKLIQLRGNWNGYGSLILLHKRVCYSNYHKGCFTTLCVCMCNAMHTCMRICIRIRTHTSVCTRIWPIAMQLACEHARRHVRHMRTCATKWGCTRLHHKRKRICLLKSFSQWSHGKVKPHGFCTLLADRSWTYNRYYRK